MAQCKVNRLTDTSEILFDVVVGKSQDLNTQTFQILGSLPVIFLFVFFEMLGSVQFNGQFSLFTVKVQNIISNDFLFIKLCWIVSQKVIPKVPFFLGHVFS